MMRQIASLLERLAGWFARHARPRTANELHRWFQTRVPPVHAPDGSFYSVGLRTHSRADGGMVLEYYRADGRALIAVGAITEQEAVDEAWRRRREIITPAIR